MAEIVNLRTARKRKAKAAESDQAAQNRQKFGRTKAEKSLSKSEADQATKKLDGHKRDE
ncbi:DUF4169 family protein [Devosia rhodophyticola]|uniref:DUF4169 family protein n=1 Tax=Devosia rhodophyticola TaxID=3026423 RepID=A0ABY7YY75_9HYPH|nr:DUF4169 family protein [Devosia rhodophyticola]WDR05844.1 DUF4169 family protein [Devosia rhodophyticola]